MSRKGCLALALLLSSCASPSSQSVPPVAKPPPAPAAEFKVRFSTTQGDFVLRVVREWAPLGADRFQTLVESGFYDGARFFRVLPGFVAQFGINGDPLITKKWDKTEIKDDPVKRSNTRGRITFATGGPDTRTTQVFINFSDKNARLDSKGFSPFGEVIEGMEVVEKLHSGYGEGAPSGKGPDQDRIEKEGNAYLERDFPKLDFIKSARIFP
jgi:peptidyl-prolyl cis-trans isomerase A (cyclophilin A)